LCRSQGDKLTMSDRIVRCLAVNFTGNYGARDIWQLYTLSDTRLCDVVRSEISSRDESPTTTTSTWRRSQRYRFTRSTTKDRRGRTETDGCMRHRGPGWLGRSSMRLEGRCQCAGQPVSSVARVHTQRSPGRRGSSCCMHVDVRHSTAHSQHSGVPE